MAHGKLNDSTDDRVQLCVEWFSPTEGGEGPWRAYAVRPLRSRLQQCVCVSPSRAHASTMDFPQRGFSPTARDESEGAMERGARALPCAAVRCGADRRERRAHRLSLGSAPWRRGTWRSDMKHSGMNIQLAEWAGSRWVTLYQCTVAACRVCCSGVHKVHIQNVESAKNTRMHTC